MSLAFWKSGPLEASFLGDTAEAGSHERSESSIMTQWRIRWTTSLRKNQGFL